jgi:transposase
MPRQGKYPDDLRERAVRMVLDHEGEYGSQWEAICSVADKLGSKAETVRLWVRQAERDQGRFPAHRARDRDGDRDASRPIARHRDGDRDASRPIARHRAGDFEVSSRLSAIQVRHRRRSTLGSNSTVGSSPSARAWASRASVGRWLPEADGGSAGRRLGA